MYIVYQVSIKLLKCLHHFSIKLITFYQTKKKKPFTLRLLLLFYCNERQQEANPEIMKKWENDHTQNYFRMGHYCCSMLKRIERVFICARHTMALERALERWFNWKLIVREINFWDFCLPLGLRFRFSIPYLRSVTIFFGTISYGYGQEGRHS